MTEVSSINKLTEHDFCNSRRAEVEYTNEDFNSQWNGGYTHNSVIGRYDSEQYADYTPENSSKPGRGRTDRFYLWDGQNAENVNFEVNDLLNQADCYPSRPGTSTQVAPDTRLPYGSQWGATKRILVQVDRDLSIPPVSIYSLLVHELSVIDFQVLGERCFVNWSTGSPR